MTRSSTEFHQPRAQPKQPRFRPSHTEVANGSRRVRCNRWSQFCLARRPTGHHVCQSLKTNASPVRRVCIKQGSKVPRQSKRTSARLVAGHIAHQLYYTNSFWHVSWSDPFAQRALYSPNSANQLAVHNRTRCLAVAAALAGGGIVPHTHANSMH